jgi:hypothetical protein
VRYTSLLVTEAGVVLYEAHARRLAPDGGAARLRFDGFAATAAPGAYALLDDGARLDVRPRPGTALRDGMPTRVLPSPLAGSGGAIPKPPPPGPYAALRAPGIATLLASRDGAELWEACVAAVVSWDGARLVLVPEDRPRVASVAEAAVRAGFPHAVAPIAAGGGAPLLLVNALKGTCTVAAPGRAPFPERVRAELDGLIAATARRP